MSAKPSSFSFASRCATRGILRTKKPYADLGADYFDQRDRERIERHHIHRLEQLGYTVTLMPKEAA